MAKTKTANGNGTLRLGDLKPLTPNARKRTDRSASMLADKDATSKAPTLIGDGDAHGR